EFPKKKLAGALGKRRVQNLAIFAVGPVPAHADARPPVPFLLAVVIKCEMIRPAIVGRPGRVAALKEKVTAAIVTDNENDIALQSFLLRRQLPKVDAAGPIVGNDDMGGRVPPTLAESLFTNWRIGLHLAFEGSEAHQESPALAAVISQPIQVDH